MTRTVWLVIDPDRGDYEEVDAGVVIGGAMEADDARDYAEQEGLDPNANLIAVEILDPGERYLDEGNGDTGREWTQ